MAQKFESTLVVTFSTLVREDEETKDPFDDDTIAKLESILYDFIGDQLALIEVTKA